MAAITIMVVMKGYGAKHSRQRPLILSPPHAELEKEPPICFVVERGSEAGYSPFV